ncbi:MAG: ABC transporter permease [Planctomycetota bacterium]|jgi:peptide/nickel transport system permease protein
MAGSDAPGALRRFRRNHLAVAGAGLIALLALASLVGPLVYRVGYAQDFPGEKMTAPCAAHPFGTDRTEFDVLARILYGGRASLLIALAATVIALVLALTAGLTAGYAGGWVDACLMRVTDTFYAFPSILLAMVLVSMAQEHSMWTVFVALGATSWTGLARLVRAQVLTVRETEYVQAAKALGLSPLRVALRHVLPNCLGPVVVAATLLVGSNILGEAGLGFLGLSVQTPFPSWGTMLFDSRGDFSAAPWLMIFPGLSITMAVLSFNLIGDGLRDALDPKGSQLHG